MRAAPDFRSGMTCRLIALGLRYISPRRMFLVEREQRNRLAVLLECDRDRGESRVRRLSRHVDGSSLADDLVRFDDGDDWRRAAARNVVGGDGREHEDDYEYDEPTEHGLNDTSLVKFAVPRRRVAVSSSG